MTPSAKSIIILPLSVILAELLLACEMVLGGRVINAHDALQYLTAQYSFLNNSMISGEIPQWLPFMMQGSSTAPWWFGLQSSLLQLVLLLTGNLFQGVPFLVFFYGGIFLDTLLFLVGVWLLARRFFSVEAAFVVTVSAVGSLAWVQQPWFNFHFVFAVPMILHCLHCVLETGRWRYLTLAASLFALQILCGLPYFAPVISLVIFLYFLFYSVVNFHDVRQAWARLRWGLPFWAAFVSGLVFPAAVGILLGIGTENIVMYVYGRSFDRTSSLPHFLTYGEYQEPHKWIELVLGVSPQRDHALYIGILGVFFLAVGLLNLRRRSLHFLLLALVMLAFGMGTWVATFFYYTWPFMKFYRHLALTTCFVKLFFCFLAGLGFEVLFQKGEFRRRRVALAILWGLVAILLFSLASSPTWRGKIFGDPFFDPFVDMKLVYRAVRRTALIALIACLFCLAIGLRRRWTGRSWKGVAAFFLVLHFADLFSYKHRDLYIKTNRFEGGKAPSRELFRFQPLPYRHRRERLTTGTKNPRFWLFMALDPRGNPYCITQSFLFHDEAGSYYRSEYWDKPFDQLMKALGGQSLSDANPPAGYVRWRWVVYPMKPPAARKIAGIDVEKIQFFSEAYLVESEDGLAGILGNPRFKGHLLFLLSPQEPVSLPRATAWKDQVPLFTSRRLKMPYRVERFDSNHLELALETPPSQQAWLYYSDLWHPFWKARVDGESVPVLRANLAYKAVPIKAGARRVHFYFHSLPLSLLQKLMGFIALFWLVLLLSWVRKCLFLPKGR